MTMRKTPLLALAAAAIVPVFACGGGDKPADSPQPTYSASGAYNQPPPGGYPPGTYPPPNNGYPPQNGYPPAGGTAPPQGSAAPAASGGLAGVPIDPNLLQQITAAGAAMMGQGGVAVGDPTDVGLKAAATRFAIGMQPEGQVYKDSLPADGHKGIVVTLQGGKCYTIIAYSPPGQVTNVDLVLLVPPLYTMAAGQDDTADNTAVIGKGRKPLCPFAPFPIQYKLDVHAKTGQGAIAVQVYSKTK